MRSLTQSLFDVGEYLYDKLLANQSTLKLEAVFYGDQERLPVTPVACVETGTLRQELAGANRRVDAEFIVYVLVYHNAVQDASTTRIETEKRAEAVKNLIEEDPKQGGLVIHSLVSDLQHGYVTKGGNIVRASRLTVTCTSRYNLPPVF